MENSIIFDCSILQFLVYDSMNVHGYGMPWVSHPALDGTAIIICYDSNVILQEHGEHASWFFIVLARLGYNDGYKIGLDTIHLPTASCRMGTKSIDMKYETVRFALENALFPDRIGDPIYTQMLREDGVEVFTYRDYFDSFIRFVGSTFGFITESFGLTDEAEIGLKQFIRSSSLGSNEQLNNSLGYSAEGVSYHGIIGDELSPKNGLNQFLSESVEVLKGLGKQSIDSLPLANPIIYLAGKNLKLSIDSFIDSTGTSIVSATEGSYSGGKIHIPEIFGRYKGKTFCDLPFVKYAPGFGDYNGNFYYPLRKGYLANIDYELIKRYKSSIFVDPHNYRAMYLIEENGQYYIRTKILGQMYFKPPALSVPSGISYEPHFNNESSWLKLWLLDTLSSFNSHTDYYRGYLYSKGYPISRLIGHTTGYGSSFRDIVDFYTKGRKGTKLIVGFFRMFLITYIPPSEIVTFFEGKKPFTFNLYFLDQVIIDGFSFRVPEYLPFLDSVGFNTYLHIVCVGMNFFLLYIFIHFIHCIYNRKSNRRMKRRMKKSFWFMRFVGYVQSMGRLLCARFSRRYIARRMKYRYRHNPIIRLFKKLHLLSADLDIVFLPAYGRLREGRNSSKTAGIDDIHVLLWSYDFTLKHRDRIRLGVRYNKAFSPFFCGKFIYALIMRFVAFTYYYAIILIREGIVEILSILPQKVLAGFFRMYCYGCAHMNLVFLQYTTLLIYKSIGLFFVDVSNGFCSWLFYPAHFFALNSFLLPWSRMFYYLRITTYTTYPLPLAKPFYKILRLFLPMIQERSIITLPKFCGSVCYLICIFVGVKLVTFLTICRKYLLKSFITTIFRFGSNVCYFLCVSITFRLITFFVILGKYLLRLVLYCIVKVCEVHFKEPFIIVWMKLFILNTMQFIFSILGIVGFPIYVGIISCYELVYILRILYNKTDIFINYLYYMIYIIGFVTLNLIKSIILLPLIVLIRVKYIIIIIFLYLTLFDLNFILDLSLGIFSVQPFGGITSYFRAELHCEYAHGMTIDAYDMNSGIINVYESNQAYRNNLKFYQLLYGFVFKRQSELMCIYIPMPFLSLFGYDPGLTFHLHEFNVTFLKKLPYIQQLLIMIFFIKCSIKHGGIIFVSYVLMKTPFIFLYEFNSVNAYIYVTILILKMIKYIIFMILSIPEFIWMYMLPYIFHCKLGLIRIAFSTYDEIMFDPQRFYLIRTYFGVNLYLCYWGINLVHYAFECIVDTFDFVKSEVLSLIDYIFTLYNNDSAWMSGEFVRFCSESRTNDYFANGNYDQKLNITNEFDRLKHSVMIEIIDIIFDITIYGLVDQIVYRINENSNLSDVYNGMNVLDSVPVNMIDMGMYRYGRSNAVHPCQIINLILYDLFGHTFIWRGSVYFIIQYLIYICQTLCKDSLLDILRINLPNKYISEQDQLMSDCLGRFMKSRYWYLEFIRMRRNDFFGYITSLASVTLGHNLKLHYSCTPTVYRTFEDASNELFEFHPAIYPILDKSRSHDFLCRYVLLLCLYRILLFIDPRACKPKTLYNNTYLGKNNRFNFISHMIRERSTISLFRMVTNKMMSVCTSDKKVYERSKSIFRRILINRLLNKVFLKLHKNLYMLICVMGTREYFIDVVQMTNPKRFFTLEYVGVYLKEINLRLLKRFISKKREQDTLDELDMLEGFNGVYKSFGVSSYYAVVDPINRSMDLCSKRIIRLTYLDGANSSGTMLDAGKVLEFKGSSRKLRKIYADCRDVRESIKELVICNWSTLLRNQVDTLISCLGTREQEYDLFTIPKNINNSLIYDFRLCNNVLGNYLMEMSPVDPNSIHDSIMSNDTGSEDEYVALDLESPDFLLERLIGYGAYYSEVFSDATNDSFGSYHKDLAMDVYSPSGKTNLGNDGDDTSRSIEDYIIQENVLNYLHARKYCSDNINSEDLFSISYENKISKEISYAVELRRLLKIARTKELDELEAKRKARVEKMLKPKKQGVAARDGNDKVVMVEYKPEKEEKFDEVGYRKRAKIMDANNFKSYDNTVKDLFIGLNSAEITTEPLLPFGFIFLLTMHVIYTAHRQTGIRIYALTLTESELFLFNYIIVPQSEILYNFLMNMYILIMVREVIGLWKIQHMMVLTHLHILIIF